MNSESKESLPNAKPKRLHLKQQATCVTEYIAKMVRLAANIKGFTECKNPRGLTHCKSRRLNEFKSKSLDCSPIPHGLIQPEIQKV